MWATTTAFLGATLIAAAAFAGPDVFESQDRMLRTRINIRSPIQLQPLRPAPRALPAQPVSVPELDPSGASAALGLLVCGGLFVAARRRRR